MINLANVTKRYHIRGRDCKIILNDVSACFPDGVNVGVLGLNGVGKSTLIKIISGSELPDAGQVLRNGQVSFPLGFASIFHPDLSGRENVTFVSRVYGVNQKAVIQYVKSFSEIGEYFDAPVKYYSSGMLAKLAFGLCLAIDFDTYLIDEITEVGDGVFRHKAAAAFKARAKTSNIILVSHNVDTIKEYCDVCAILSNGKLNMYSSVSEGLIAFRSIVAEAELSRN